MSGQLRDVGRNETLTRDSTTVGLRDRIGAADARELAAGDEIRLAGRTVATIEDVAIYATGNPTQLNVFVGATLETHRSQGERRFGGTPLRRGQTVTLPTSEYTLNGRIERIGGGLALDSVDVVIETTVDAETASDSPRATPRQSQATTPPRWRASRRTPPGTPSACASLSPLVADARVWRTRTLRHHADVARRRRYHRHRPVHAVRAHPADAHGRAGRHGDRTVTLRMSEVREDMAETIEPGMTKRANGETIAHVTAVDTHLSLIITTGENGSVNAVDHPFNRNVEITTSLRVRETTTGPRFKREPLRQGSTVVVGFGTIFIEAEVVSVSG